jgi:prepilin-type N-terminal cleavage/methylation domain-containing protein
MKTRGFTLLELLVAVAVIALLITILMPVVNKMRLASWRAVSTHSLRQLGAAGAAYVTEHDGVFWKYRENRPEGVVWWFGQESKTSLMQGEGDRTLDLTKGPLGPYAIASSGVKSDPAFMKFSPRHKPKFSNGNYGYGYNAHLGGGALGRKPLGRISMISHPSNIVVFATCAQVNNFQSPASFKNPMIEEFYLLDAYNTTVHFRFGGKALASMADGSIRELPMDGRTLDSRMPGAQIARFAPLGDPKHLVDWE